jgi:cytochrome P450
MVLARAGGAHGVDLSQIERVPERLSWPLQRHGVDPVERLSELRDRQPVAKLTSFLGMTVWVVSGHEESRAVLADTSSYSNDIRPLMGSRGSSTDGDIGGLGFTDPPDHTRLRRLLTPEFTMRRLVRLRPRVADIVESQLDEMERVAGTRADGVVDLVPTFAFPVPFLVIWGRRGSTSPPEGQACSEPCPGRAAS